MKTIDDTESAVSEVEDVLTQFDDLTAAVKAKTSEIATLQAEHESNTADHSADFAKRLKIHSANASALVLHQADLLTLQSNADGQKRKVIALGKATGDGLASLSSQLQALARRRSGAGNSPRSLRQTSHSPLALVVTVRIGSTQPPSP